MKFSQSGFTVVEMLVSLALFAILIPTLTVGVSTLTQINNRARDLTLVSIIGENKVESLRSLGYNAISTGTVDFSGELPRELASPKSGTYTVVESGGNKTITVTITYSDYKKTKTVNYKSIVSETGVAQ